MLASWHKTQENKRGFKIWSKVLVVAHCNCSQSLIFCRRQDIWELQLRCVLAHQVIDILAARVWGGLGLCWYMFDDRKLFETWSMASQNGRRPGYLRSANQNHQNFPEDNENEIFAFTQNRIDSWGLVHSTRISHSSEGDLWARPLI